MFLIQEIASTLIAGVIVVVVGGGLEKDKESILESLIQKQRSYMRYALISNKLLRSFAL